MRDRMQQGARSRHRAGACTGHRSTKRRGGKARAAAEAVAAAIAVDDFAPEELTPPERCHKGDDAIASDLTAARPADRPRGVGRPSGLHHRRQPHAVHQGARQAGAVHAGRSRGAVRAAAAAAPAVRAGRVRSGHPRLRQRHRRRDEPGARRRAAARHGRGDDRLHGADQLRLGHAVDRHRLPLHPGRHIRPHPRRRRRSAQPCAAGVQPQRGRMVRAAVRGARDLARSSRRSPASARRSSSR